MDVFNIFATNIAQEADGKFFSKEFGGDVQFLISRTGNPKYARLLSAAYEDNKAILDDKSTDEARAAGQKLNDKIMIEIMAKSILLGWTGKVEWKGQPLPYSVENAALLLSLPEFRKKVAALADDYKNYRLALEAEDKANLQPTSNGASPGGPASFSLNP